MANFKEIIYNDGKGKNQSYEYTIVVTEDAPWHYNCFSSITGYGENEQEAKEKCLAQLREMLNDLINFINK